MLGDKIKLYRENKKMTQNDIADILDVSAGTVSKYESGSATSVIVYFVPTGIPVIVAVPVPSIVNFPSLVSVLFFAPETVIFP